jgi:hypothetical protein
VEAIFNVLRHRGSSASGPSSIRCGGATDHTVIGQGQGKEQGQGQGQGQGKEQGQGQGQGKEGGDREVARRAPVKPLARAPAVERGGWNDDASTGTGHAEDRVRQGSLVLDSRHTDTQHRGASSGQPISANSDSSHRGSIGSGAGAGAGDTRSAPPLPSHRPSQLLKEAKEIPKLNANCQKMRSEIAKLEYELENSSNSLKKMQIRREISSIKAQMG